MAEKRKKIVQVDNLIIHAKNVEIKDAENVKIDRVKNLEHNQKSEEQFSRGNPWDFFWGGLRPSREPMHEVNGELKNVESEPSSELDQEH